MNCRWNLENHSTESQHINVRSAHVTELNENNVERHRTWFAQFLLNVSLLGCGVLGLSWSVFRYANATSSSANAQFAFLDDFSARQAEFQREIEEQVNRRRENEADERSRRENSSQAATPTLPRSLNLAESAARSAPGSQFYAKNLEIDLSSEGIRERLRDDVTYLASDALEGRGIRTRGLVQAGDFIAEEFRKSGLDTAWYNNSPFQEFELLTASRKGAVQRVQFHRSTGDQYLLTPNVDFSSLLKTSMGTMTCPVVFVGYGITAPELGYDDYSGINASGKAVIVLRQEPQQSRADSPFHGTESTRHAPVFSKIENAIAHGAAAVILCDTRLLSQAHSAEDPFSSELLKVEFSDDAFDTTIPVIHCRRQLINQYLAEYDSPSLNEFEQQIDETLKPQSREITGFEVGFEVARSKSGSAVRNVMASIEPNGISPQRTVVVGAHYDHLGRDGWGSLAVGADGEIHNGADDNASGTAVLLEVARQLAAHREDFKCRVLFIAFTAEELGLLGSKHYIRDPAVPLVETIAMVNLDMVGRLREQATIYGTGTAQEWPSLIANAAANLDFQYASRSSGYGPSDHAVFSERGVPVLHFFTGFHSQYHRPADDSNLLNIDGMRKIALCVSKIVSELARHDESLSPGSQTDDLFLADSGLSAPDSESLTRTARFGVVLRELPGQNGVEITKVLPSSVAQHNGLQAGDVLIQMNETEIAHVEDVRNVIRQQKIGEKLPVRVKRRSLELEIDILF